MMMNRVSSIHRIVKHSVVLGAISSIAVLAGWVPNLTGSSANLFDASASAQEAAFTRYVRSAVALEQKRLALEDQLRQLTGGNVPPGVCQNINQLDSGVRDRVQGLCQQFRQSFYQILSQQNPPLSLEEFNSFQSQVGNRQMCERVAQEAQRLKIGEISCKDAR